MVFCPQNIVKTVRKSLDNEILKIILVSLSGNKTSCSKMGLVRPPTFHEPNLIH